MGNWLRIVIWVAITVVIGGLTGCSRQEAPQTPAAPTANEAARTAPQGGTLKIIWAKWPPADYLQELSKDFTKETGIQVVVDQVPWDNFQDKVFTVFAAKEDTYDLFVGDSQWLGKGASEGHYVELTRWMKDNVDISSISEGALTNYGEYPKGSKRYYALPAEGDATAFAYRKDLFEDPREKEAFKKRYGRELAPPKTWAELRDIAEFFTRPNNKPKPLYGLAVFYSRQYDGITMGFQQVMWSYGGSYGHEKTRKVEGILNSPKAVEALKFYISLKKFSPPGSEKNYFNEDTTAFTQGDVAMAQNWFAFFPALLDRKTNPYWDRTGFFPTPAGPAGHYISLGGQGISISNYSKNKENAFKYLKWFAQEETQRKWAKLGGYTANTKVMASEDFLKAAPYNPAFAESFKHVRDFWAVPEYAKLLDSCQKHWNAAVVGQETPQQAMDNVAKEHQAIFDKAGKPKA